MAHVANLTIDNTKVPANLTDFPVYVNLADMNAEFWSTVANGGGDIRVFKSDGTTELPREVVSCDTTAETGELHFKYTGTLSSTADTEVQIHADGTSADYAVTAAYGRNAVWSDYAVVWHGNDATTSTVTDATGNGNDGTKRAASNPAEVTGQIGDGQDHERTNNDYISTVDDTTLDFGTGALTVSAWVKTESSGIFGGILTKIATGADLQGYGMRIVSSDKIEGIVWDGAGANDLVVSTNTLSTNTWYKTTFTRDGTNLKIYRNGSNDSESTVTDNARQTNNSEVFATGGYRSYDLTANMFDGVIDEMRAKGSATTDSWETTEYNNQNSPSTFYTVTDAEAVDTTKFFAMMA